MSKYRKRKQQKRAVIYRLIIKIKEFKCKNDGYDIIRRNTLIIALGTIINTPIMSDDSKGIVVSINR